MRCFGFGILTFKMFSGGNAKGVSAKSLQLYALVFLSRLCAIMRHQGYLPYDKSGDWFYHFVEAISLASTLLVLYLIFVPLRPTYSEKYDKFGNLHIPNEFGACYILVPALLCAIFFHP
jgi:ER lumen protein retaining receptor